MERVSITIQLFAFAIGIAILVFANVSYINGAIAASETRVLDAIRISREEMHVDFIAFEARFNYRLTEAHTRIDRLYEEG